MEGGSGPYRVASSPHTHYERRRNVVVRKILNYTPHVVTIYRGERVLHSYPSLGCAMVMTKEEKSASILVFPLNKSQTEKLRVCQRQRREQYTLSHP